MADATDYRRTAEPDLLDAIRGGQPLALAEAYHRLVPAAHAVARRLMPDAAEVEQVLLSVFAQLWERPPAAGPLEGWVRRTTWAAGAERLRADGRAPASPSASALLPDLPAPDLRFLDAAERAIAELHDDERRALLLAHDKGVPSDSQDPGAGDALVRALLALAGPETSSSDRAAQDADACDDFATMGDWCLGIADPQTASTIDGAISERPGCAAKSRAVRRGRRRIEGLPATPDMGQRVLVSVLTTSSRPVAAQAAPAAADQADTAPPAVPSEDEPGEDALAISPDPDEHDVAADAPVESADPMTAAADDEPVTADVADAMIDTADLPAARAAAQAAAVPVDTGTEPGAEPGAEPGSDDVPTADEATDWAPQPGDTAELRLSDILAGDDEDDDPFASLGDEPEDVPDFPGTAEPVAPAAAGGSPYSALQDLDQMSAGDSPAAAPFSADPSPAAPLAADPNVYVEGQDVPEPAPAARSRSAMATAMSWILPILGGLAVGILLAVQVFGAP